MSFLYLLTGCLDLALMAGQKKQRLPHAGNTWRDITPETTLIFDLLLSFPSKPNTIIIIRPGQVRPAQPSPENGLTDSLSLKSNHHPAQPVIAIVIDSHSQSHCVLQINITIGCKLYIHQRRRRNCIRKGKWILPLCLSLCGRGAGQGRSLNSG